MLKTWDNQYKSEGIIQNKPEKKVLDAIRYFKENNFKRILDLGCGTGRYIEFLDNDGFEVYGCDISQKGLDITQNKFPNIYLRQSDFDNLPYKDSYFDAVLCNFVINHGKVEKIKKGIQEIVRVLKDNGILYMSVPSVEHPDFQTGKEIEKNTKIHIDDPIDGDLPHHFFEEGEFEEILKPLRVIKIKHFSGTSQKNPKKQMAAYSLYAKK